MKLLLTSEGLGNSSLKNAFLNLLPKDPKELKLLFIPTAMNVEKGDKRWLVKNFDQVAGIDFKEVDIMDVAAVPESVWRERLENADVIVLGGGNTFYLMHVLTRDGLGQCLADQINKGKIYVGISAGSMVVSKSLSLSNSNRIFLQEFEEYKSDDGLGLVDFQLMPHYRSPEFFEMNDDMLEAESKLVTDVVYAIDDDTAIKVIDKEIEIVSEGEWRAFNEK